MFIHEASDEILLRFIRCMFRVHQMFAGDLWGKFWLFIGCFLSVEGSLEAYWVSHRGSLRISSGLGGLL